MIYAILSWAAALCVIAITVHARVERNRKAASVLRAVDHATQAAKAREAETNGHLREERRRITAHLRRAYAAGLPEPDKDRFAVVSEEVGKLVDAFVAAKEMAGDKVSER